MCRWERSENREKETSRRTRNLGGLKEDSGEDER